MTKTKLYISLYLTSFTLFIYELFVSRIFSVILSNQFSYLVISFAILGLGLGGILIHYLGERKSVNINVFITGYIISYLATITVFFIVPYLGSPFWYTLLGVIPFIFGGGIISYFFKTQADTFSVYFYDLIGGVTGLTGGMLLMKHLGTTISIIVSFALVMLLAFVLSDTRKAKMVLLIIIGAVLLSTSQLATLYDSNFNSFRSSPYVGFPEGSDFKYSNWDSFARTDAVWSERNPDQMLVSLNGRSFSRVIKYDGDLAKVDFLKDTLGYFPLKIGSPESVALIGPGGGEEIIYSFLAGIADITAVEINKATVEAVSSLKDFTGDIYNDPRVKTVVGDGRSFIQKVDRKYDQIYLSLVMTNIGDSVANTLTENYIYTEEALGDYFEKLNPEGQVSFIFHSPNDLLKMLMTSISYLERQGIPREEMADHFILVKAGKTHMYPVMLVRMEPYSRAEADVIVQKTRESGLMAVNIPHLSHEKILHMYSKQGMAIDQIVKQNPVNITPIYDDRPFFYYSEKGIPHTLVILLTGALLLVAVALIFGLAKKSEKMPGFIKKFGIFMLLGMGFMLIEITLIQKLAVFLEHPVNSFVLVIASLLTGAGLSNIIQSRRRIFSGHKPVFYLVGLAAAVIILLNIVIYRQGINSLGLKFSLVIMLLLPLGFMMGIPFPLVINKLQEDKLQGMIPYFWGINGIGSVLGSALTMVSALKIGFNHTYILGIILYLGVAFLIKNSIKYH